MGNRLSKEQSPYLLSHANNPVDWYPWGEEAFAAARGRDVPLFVSIGYSACHWCHVMELESFEDAALKRFGLRLARRGGAGAKARAVVATARKLSVLLLALWKSGEVYEPLRAAADKPESGRAEGAAA